MSELSFPARSSRQHSPDHAPTRGSTSHRPVQAKLVVGSADDPYEREADSVADEVIDVLHARTGDSHAHRVMAAPVTRISRLATVGAEGGDLDNETEREIINARVGGKPLEGKIRRRMEGAFGTDFGDVRVHLGATSDALNTRIQARAFTAGSDIFVRRQDYQPDSRSGEKLLAHELAHTVQQRGGQQGGGQQAGGARGAMQRTSVTIQRWGFSKDKVIEARNHDKPTTSAPKTHQSVNENFEFGTKLTKGSGAVNEVDGYKDTIAKINNGGKTPDKVEGKSGATKQDATNLKIAGGATDVASMFISISKCVAVFGDKSKSKVDKAGAVIETGASVVSGGKGVSTIVKGATTSDTAKDGMAGAKEANGVLSGLADAAGAIKSGFDTVRKMVELAKEAAGMSDEERFKASMEIVRSLLETAKGVVSTVKDFLDLCGSGVTAAMVNTIPGLGIAIAAAELVVRGFDLVMSISRANEMKASKRDVKKSLGGEQGTSIEQRAKNILASPDTNPTQKAQASEYLTAKSLQYINNKRSRRALLKISIAMAKIAGDAATLGGVSAPVGIGLKVGAVAVDIGAGMFRKFKQWARDKVAEKEKSNRTGKPSFLASVFNTKKSTEMKTIEYNRIIDNVLDMIVAATPANAQPTEQETTKMLKVETYIEAMGFSIAQLDRESAKGGENLYKKMLAALKKRE